MIRASLIIATYNRIEPLRQLLSTLTNQTASREVYEVVIIDDGSKDDVTTAVKDFSSALQLAVLRQDNRGVAIARQRGALRARGRILVFLDDDMRVGNDFVTRHLAAHEGHDDRVVMGELLPDDRLADMPLFERFHADQLEKAAEEYALRGTFRGHDVYTGNLSMPRELFFRAGGFDPAFFIEDVELGVRLEKTGAKFLFSREATAVHASDHTSAETWLERSVREGRDWVKLARKHPSVHDADPWHFFTKANPLSRPFFAAAVLAPSAAPWIARLVFRGAHGTDSLGWDRAAVSLTSLVYGIQYYIGVRRETGSLGETLSAYRGFRRRERHRARSLRALRRVVTQASTRLTSTSDGRRLQQRPRSSRGAAARAPSG